MKPLAMSSSEEDPVPTLSAQAPAASFDLSSLLDAWRGKDHTAVLLKTESLRVVFRSLRQGNSLSTHKAAGDITVQVLEGEIQFTASDRTVSLRTGQLFALRAAVPHSLTAVQSSAILITLASGQRA